MMIMENDLYIRTIPQMVNQSLGGFEVTQKGYFYQRARDSEIRLAQKVVQRICFTFIYEESFQEESSRRK